MMNFEPVTLTWKGESYTVPADGQMKLIAVIEDALRGDSSMQAVQLLMREGGPSYVRLSQAFGAALRFAGADVSDEEIYLSIQNDFASSSANVAILLQGAIISLLSIISPPLALAVKAPDVKKKTPRARKKA